MRRLESLDTMRGLAALGVCLYHFARGLPKGSVQEAFFSLWIPWC
jgi:peptidoglycan/LPS O-acetylase OafA/YrhL